MTYRNNIYKIYTDIRFEWDETKNRLNRTKHGVWFEEAKSVFDDPLAHLFHDPEHSDEENRFLVLGVSLTARVLVVSHCYRGSEFQIRLISARLATKLEREFYEEGV